MGDIVGLENIAIEQVVKQNGELIVAIHNADWDECGNFIGNNSELYKRAEIFVKKYNPDGLSIKDYRLAYSNNELPWQQ